MLVLALGALSAVGGVVYALFEHDLKRLLPAFSSVENIGIIVLGIGACLLLHARGADSGRRSRSRPHCCTASITRSSRRCSSSEPARSKRRRGARARPARRAARRMPWTGGAFLVGAVAIAGLPPLNGFASEWLTLQALLHVPAFGGVAAGTAGAIALGGACRDRRPRRLLLRQGQRPRAARAAESETDELGHRGALADAGRRSLPGAGLRSSSGSCRGCCSGCSPGSRHGPRTRRRRRGLHLPGTGSLPTVGIAVVLAGLTGAFVFLRGSRRAEPAPDLGLRPGDRAGAQLDERRLHEAAAARARAAPATGARDGGADRGGRRSACLLSRPCPAADRRADLPARSPRSCWAGRDRHDGCRAAASGRTPRT